VALATLAILLLVLNITPITNNDLFLHLKAGDTILTTGSVPRVDDYSALARGRPFIAHEWLASVLFRLVQLAFGWNGLIVLKALTAIMVAGLLYAASRLLGATPPIAVPALAFVMILSAWRFMERPHILTYLNVAVFLLLLARRRSGRRTPLWIFVPIQILWANLHGGFILGPAIVALAATGAALDQTMSPPPREALAREARSLALLSLVLLAASVVNPYGPRLLRLPFDLTGSSFMGEIYEWLPPLFAVDFWNASISRSPFASTYMALYYVAWMILGVLTHGVTVFLWRRERLIPPGGAFPILLFIAFLFLSMLMNRGVADFALATFPGVAAHGTGSALWLLRRFSIGPAASPDGRPAAALAVVTGVLLLLSTWFALVGYPLGPSLRRSPGLGIGRNIPVGAVDYLAEIGLRGNVFNTYASGAYLIYRLYPDVRVAMDSRNEVYGEELYRLYTRALTDADALEELLNRLHAVAVLLEWPGQGMMTAAATVHRIKSWRPVYFDDIAVVYLRGEAPWAEVEARDGYALLDPALYRGGAIRRENAARALQEAERSLSRRPSYTARVMRIDALLGLGRDDEALREIDRILAEKPPLSHVYTNLAWIRLARGERGEAAACFRKALALQPESQVALQGLSLAQQAASR
jgi:tetratricopeptide (TPR) repeat protein